MFLKGMKRHISEMGERGVSNRTIAQYEQDLTTLEQQNAEVDKIRAELNAKVKVMNETLMMVKETYNETKKVIKGYYPQDRHNAQYAPIAVATFRLSHDRFLCIDDDVYHIGASIKDLGKKWFGFSKMDILTPDELVGRINR